MELMIGLGAGAALVACFVIVLLILGRKRGARIGGVVVVAIVAVGIGFGAEGAISRQRCIDDAVRYNKNHPPPDVLLPGESLDQRSTGECKFDPP
jgi:hypothetical protein